MKSANPSENTWKSADPSKNTMIALRELKKGDKFVEAIRMAIVMIRVGKEIGYFDNFYMPKKKVREKLDAIKDVIDATPYTIGSMIPGLEKVRERVQEPLEATAPNRKYPKTIRLGILVWLRSAFNDLDLPITTYPDGLFAITAEIVCEELGVDDINSQFLAREAAQSE